jgi:hypothetical protein
MSNVIQMRVKGTLPDGRLMLTLALDLDRGEIVGVVQQEEGGSIYKVQSVRTDALAIEMEVVQPGATVAMDPISAILRQLGVEQPEPEEEEVPRPN